MTRLWAPRGSLQTNMLIITSRQGRQESWGRQVSAAQPPWHRNHPWKCTLSCFPAPRSCESRYRKGPSLASGAAHGRSQANDPQAPVPAGGSVCLNVVSLPSLPAEEAMRDLASGVSAISLAHTLRPSLCACCFVS